MSSPLKQNTTTIQDLLNTINSLPEAGGTDTSDATASANEILQGETAYVNGEKVTGTFSIDNELTTQDDLITQLQSVVDELPEAGGSGDSNINYFFVQNNLSHEDEGLRLYVDGVFCPTGDITAIPYDVTNYSFPLFMLTFECSDIAAVYESITEDENVGSYIEELSAVPIFSFNIDAETTTGALIGFSPNPEEVVNNTVIFEDVVL